MCHSQLNIIDLDLVGQIGANATSHTINANPEIWEPPTTSASQCQPMLPVPAGAMAANASRCQPVPASASRGFIFATGGPLRAATSGAPGPKIPPPPPRSLQKNPQKNPTFRLYSKKNLGKIRENP